MRFEELNWMDVEEYLQDDDRLILVWGATEQHAYLSLLTDVKIPLALADAASRQTGVLVAPPLNFGVSPYFLSYPGTLSLRLETLLDLTADVVRSAYGQGFRRFLFLNGHGGNNPAQTLLYELANQFPDMRAEWYSWWQAPGVAEVAAKHGLAPTHANWQEAFPFTRVAEMPEGEKPLPETRGVQSADNLREIYGDGSFGGRYLAEDSIMNELFEVCLQDVLRLLKFE